MPVPLWISCEERAAGRTESHTSLRRVAHPCSGGHRRRPARGLARAERADGRDRRGQDHGRGRAGAAARRAGRPRGGPRWPGGRAGRGPAGHRRRRAGGGRAGSRRGSRGGGRGRGRPPGAGRGPQPRAAPGPHGHGGRHRRGGPPAGRDPRPARVPAPAAAGGPARAAGPLRWRQGAGAARRVRIGLAPAARRPARAGPAGVAGPRPRARGRAAALPARRDRGGRCARWRAGRAGRRVGTPHQRRGPARGGRARLAVPRGRRGRGGQHGAGRGVGAARPAGRRRRQPVRPPRRGSRRAGRGGRGGAARPGHAQRRPAHAGRAGRGCRRARGLGAPAGRRRRGPRPGRDPALGQPRAAAATAGQGGLRRRAVPGDAGATGGARRGRPHPDAGVRRGRRGRRRPHRRRRRLPVGRAGPPPPGAGGDPPAADRRLRRPPLRGREALRGRGDDHRGADARLRRPDHRAVADALGHGGLRPRPGPRRGAARRRRRRQGRRPQGRRRPRRQGRQAPRSRGGRRRLRAQGGRGWRAFVKPLARLPFRRARDQQSGPGEQARVTGPVRKDKRTKNLVKRLRPGDVAVIDHLDLDRVAAETLAECRPVVVINVASSISGRYPNPGPMILLEAGVPMLDATGPAVFGLREGEPVRVDEHGSVLRGDTEIARGEWLAPEDVRKRVDAAKDNLAAALEDFTLNTLSYVRRDRDLLLEGLDLPPLETSLRDRHVLVVVRGHDYKKDLVTLRGYISEFRPVLIGVDGGADALLEAGFKPDIILGDMDSVTNEALACGAEIVVHAYPDGRAPGRERVERLGLDARILPGAGTSEDMAMLLAYEADCDLIVAVGTQASMVDFLDKGRAGMASTFLVRLKVGTKLVDAKGVNRLYRQGVRRADLLVLVGAALAAMLVATVLSESFREVWETIFELVRVFVHRLVSLF